MSLPNYPAYTDSGVEWIGKIPTGWCVSPIKRQAQLKNNRATVRKFPVALENIESKTGKFIFSDTKFEGDGVFFQKNDILFGKLRPYLAKIWLADKEGEAVGDFYVIRPTLSSPDFLRWVLFSDEVISQIDSSTFGAKMPRASWPFIRKLLIPVPSYLEQKAIASFLDRECDKIDALLAEQERLIALLAEKRQAVISHAVTKGLNSGILMKDSGIPWIGMVPEGWEVVPASYRYEVQLGRMLNEERTSGDHMRPYLRVLDVQWSEINISDLPMMDFPPEAQARYRLKVGDLLVNEGGSYVGRSAIWRGELDECYYQKALHRLRPHNPERDTGEFFYYVMEIATRRNVFVAGANQTTIDHLTAEQLRAHRFAFPPLEQQLEIVDHLKKHLSHIDSLVDSTSVAIALLKERRVSLISSAVTGKIDVRSQSKVIAA